MTIKNYEEAYRAVMQELQEISDEDLLVELQSYGRGPLGEVFSEPSEISRFDLNTSSLEKSSVEFDWSLDSFIKVEAAPTPVDAANDSTYAKAA